MARWQLSILIHQYALYPVQHDVSDVNGTLRWPFGGLHFYLEGTRALITGKYWGSTNWSSERVAPIGNYILPVTAHLIWDHGIHWC